MSGGQADITDLKPEVPTLTRWLHVTIVCPSHFAFLMTVLSLCFLPYHSRYSIKLLVSILT